MDSHRSASVGGHTRGSSRSSLGCGTSSTRLCFPWPYLIGLLETIDAQESRFVEPGNVSEVFDSDVWVAAVPGLVGGFMDRGACCLNGGGLDGCGILGLPANFAAGVGGNGLFGGCDGLPMTGLGESGLEGAGDWGKSFAGGSGGTAIVGPLLPSSFTSSRPSDRDSWIPISFSKSIISLSSMVTMGRTSTHRDGTWKTNGICRRCPADETRFVEAKGETGRTGGLAAGTWVETGVATSIKRMDWPWPWPWPWGIEGDRTSTDFTWPRTVMSTAVETTPLHSWEPVSRAHGKIISLPGKQSHGRSDARWGALGSQGGVLMLAGRET
jgi:hypothetical protein